LQRSIVKIAWNAPLSRISRVNPVISEADDQ
jgi:hypothetical protein